ncbi:MAG: WYL domain-containing protein [Oscillospiraceae bacterium]|nr:WYL domain-containing protein [Oscillospiraceae bacterium]
MSKGTNQKLKLLYLTKIFREQTDEEHMLTIAEIIEKLSAYDVSADRKTLYTDFEELRHFGLDIISQQIGRQHYYYLGAREFELPELKLLVDSVQSAKFITAQKSQKLIKKLEGLVSKYEATQLQRQVYITGRVKTMNESIYYNVDKLHAALSADAQIQFQYYQRNVKKEMELRRGGKLYQVSPWGLMWDDEYYYLVAYDAETDKIKHYRVDKMLRIQITDQKRAGKERYQSFNLPDYTKRIFGMFSGEETKVTLEADNSMAGVLIDRFGKDIMLIPQDGGRFRATVDVAISDQFLGWIVALGTVKIVGPEAVVEKMQAKVSNLIADYC